MREDLNRNWLRRWAHPIGYVHMRVLLNVPHILPALLLFLIEWHDGYSNFALSHAAFQLCQIIILLRLHLTRLRAYSLLLLFVLDLHIQVLLELLGWFRKFECATIGAVFLSHGGLRAQ